MIIPFSGTMLFLHHEKGRAKRHAMEMMKHAKDSDLKRIAIHTSEIQHIKWEQPWEFEHQGIMHDIVSQELIADSIIYHCIIDKKETSINKEIVRFIAGFFNDNPLHDQQLLSFVDFTKHLAPITEIMMSYLPQISIAECFLPDMLPYFPYATEIPTPPPQYSSMT